MFLCAAILLLAACLVDTLYGKPTNVTIDDYFGDEFSGRVPTYTGPSNNPWLSANATVMGVAKPDPSLAFQQTWHDTTYHPGDASPRSIEVHFVGTAVYAYFILGNAIPPIPLVTALTNLSFHLDDVFEDIFKHDPNMTDTNFVYNAAGFSKDGLVNTDHKLLIQTSTGNASLVLFDYVIYTADNSSVVVPSGSGVSGGTTIVPVATATASRSGDSDSHRVNITIIAAAASASAALMSGAIAAVFFLLRRRSKRRRSRQRRTDPIVSSDEDHVRQITGRGSTVDSTAPPAYSSAQAQTPTRERHKSELVEDERLQNLQAAAELRDAKWREHFAARGQQSSAA